MSDDMKNEEKTEFLSFVMQHAEWAKEYLHSSNTSHWEFADRKIDLLAKFDKTLANMCKERFDINRKIAEYCKSKLEGK